MSSPLPTFFRPDVVDQEQTVANFESYAGNKQGVSVSGAMSFQLSGEKTVTAVEFNFEGIHGTIDGNITFTIETDDDDKPSGNLVNINATKIIVPEAGIIKYVFDVPFKLSGATTYWLVRRISEQTLGNYLGIWANSEGGYDNGHASGFYLGTWHDGSPMCAWFKIYVRE